MNADSPLLVDRLCNECFEVYIPSGPDDYLCRVCMRAHEEKRANEERRAKVAQFEQAMEEMRCLTCHGKADERLWRSPAFDPDSPRWAQSSAANWTNWHEFTGFDCMRCAKALDQAAKARAVEARLHGERIETLQNLYFAVQPQSRDIDSLDAYAALDATRAAAATEVKAWLAGLTPSKTTATLYVYGEKGTGKTTLAYAVACQALRDAIVQDVEWVRVGRTVRRASRTAKELDVRMTPLMVLDDLGVQKVTPATTDLVTDLIERRYECGGLTIVTSNYTLQELASQLCVRGDPNTGGRLADRLRHNAKFVHLAGESLRGSQ